MYGTFTKFFLANFGPWEHGPQHGFARISWWKVKEQPKQVRTYHFYITQCWALELMEL